MPAVARSLDSLYRSLVEQALAVSGQPLADYAVAQMPSVDLEHPMYLVIEPHRVVAPVFVDLHQNLVMQALPDALPSER